MSVIRDRFPNLGRRSRELHGLSLSKETIRKLMIGDVSKTSAPLQSGDEFTCERCDRPVFAPCDAHGRRQSRHLQRQYSYSVAPLLLGRYALRHETDGVARVQQSHGEW